jgi:hypothetical protein
VSTIRHRGAFRSGPEQYLLAALQHELPAVRETEVGDQGWCNEKSIRSEPEQTGRAELDFEHAALRDGGVGSVERPVRERRGRRAEHHDGGQHASPHPICSILSVEWFSDALRLAALE